MAFGVLGFYSVLAGIGAVGYEACADVKAERIMMDTENALREFKKLYTDSTEEAQIHTLLESDPNAVWEMIESAAEDSTLVSYMKERFHGQWDSYERKFVDGFPTPFVRENREYAVDWYMACMGKLSVRMANEVLKDTDCATLKRWIITPPWNK